MPKTYKELNENLSFEAMDYPNKKIILGYLHGASCVYCGKLEDDVNFLTLDHIRPHCAHYEDVDALWNCILACPRCNTMKSDFEVHELKDAYGKTFYENAVAAKKRYGKDGCNSIPYELQRGIAFQKVVSERLKNRAYFAPRIALGKWLCQKRVMEGISRYLLAEILTGDEELGNADSENIAQWETGYHVPSEKNFHRLLDALGIEIKEYGIYGEAWNARKVIYRSREYKKAMLQLEAEISVNARCAAQLKVEGIFLQYGSIRQLPQGFYPFFQRQSAEFYADGKVN